MGLDFLYTDEHIAVCVKPPRVLSTDEPGGMPELVRNALGTADVRTVHRLDRVVSGLMVFARSPAAASELSRQIREDQFQKEYLAVIHGCPHSPEGRMTNLLLRDKQERKTYIVQEPAKGVQEAVLDYRVLSTGQDMAKVQVTLHTGRTHQIRVQFSSRGFPLVGERKYSTLEDGCTIALWSHRIGFYHPTTGEYREFCAEPPAQYPWTVV